MSRYRRTYALLKSAGHTPTKAWEIILDAHRGNAHARAWIKVLFSQRHDP
jgi:hypothetical protein